MYIRTIIIVFAITNSMIAYSGELAVTTGKISLKEDIGPTTGTIKLDKKIKKLDISDKLYKRNILRPDRNANRIECDSFIDNREKLYSEHKKRMDANRQQKPVIVEVGGNRRIPVELIQCKTDIKDVCVPVDTGIRCIVAPCPSVNFVNYKSACKACTNLSVSAVYDSKCVSSD